MVAKPFGMVEILVAQKYKQVFIWFFAPTMTVKKR
jgi:hypothetical protein